MKKYKIKPILDNYVFPYGVDIVDIESQLTKSLSERLAIEIDRAILSRLGIEPDRNKRRKNSIDKIFI